MKIATQLKTLRKERGLSQNDLAVLLNVSRKTVSYWESGLSKPTENNINMLCEKLNIDKSLFLPNTIDMGDRLRQLREYMGDTQEIFAKRLNISHKAYLIYENNERSVPSDILYNIIRLYGLNTNWLITGEGNMLIDKDDVIGSVMQKNINRTLKIKKSSINKQTYSGPQLQKIQEVNGLLDKDMAKIMGVSERRYMKLSLSECMLERNEIDAIVSNFDVDVNWLLYGGDNFDPQKEESPKKLSDLQLSPEQYNKLLKLLDD